MEFGFRWWSAVLFGLVFLSVLSGCRKLDEIPPDAQIISPTAGTIYNVFDTVLTTFQYSDETQVVSATVELVNADFVPVTPKTDVLERTSAELVIDNKLLETGDYYVRLVVKDEQNTNSEFRKIRIAALPKKRRAVFAAVNSSSSSSTLFRVDSLLQQSQLWKQPQQDVLEVCVNSMYEQVAIAGEYSNWLRSFDADSRVELWSDQVFTVSQTERFKDLFWSDFQLYATIYDREVRSYNLTGGLTSNLPTQQYIPEKVFADNRFLLVEMNLLGDNVHILNVYHASTRALLWQTDFQFDIIAICPLNDDEVLIFGNDGGQARVVAYDVYENTFWEPRTLPSGVVLDAVATESNRFVISHSNGLYAYTYAPNYLNQISNLAHSCIKFDEDNGTLLASTGNIINEMALNGAVINSINLSGNIQSFDIYYTR